MLEIEVSSCKDLKTSEFECFCRIIPYQLENLSLYEAVLVFKSFSRDDENYTVCGLRPHNLHHVIPLYKVGSGRPLVIKKNLASFSTPACFSKL